VDLLAIAGAAAEAAVGPSAEAGAEPGLTINLFWIIVSALNFLVFLALIWAFAFRRIAAMLDERRARIEQGLRDAEQARRDREQAAAERLAAIQEARKEATEIINRAQRAAQEAREADIAATRAELEQLRAAAQAEIEAEKQRAIADLRAEVADLALAAAAKVVGETMTDARHRRIVEEFLAETAPAEPNGGGRSGRG
jgi:F-type H+-transporting ATPase subunit b